ncbi:three-Cys-motif partner protein TcmP [Pseudomonas fuscovaginae UPB0736]|uniref:three-Cys-motif partner protein TcmP n=1 Tax=Pseudomonas asplenii TaxID=53407 RepID=UPI000288F446|nr:three-Cys-motif partner protein TcmP [Pseudomonas fuscovaginae]UUQ67774.1 three-Cys-motif partner protein TcmP [Pseudomonas fuscovaginae UPB0736]
MSLIPMEYQGREQAYVKHTILRTYLQRLFMIIGRSEKVISYVDCFAGPWSEESDDLRDTSIGISLSLMKDCAKSLEERHGAKVKFRALYIEKNDEAFAKLQRFLSNNMESDVDTSCIHGDYTTKIDDIANWAKLGFTFFFIDPKGWRKVINAPVLAPLLALNRAEFLINLMYDFLNRAMSMTAQQANVEELLGKPITFSGKESATERQNIIVSQYRQVVGDLYSGRTAYVTVERPGMDRVLYFLIYLTRHPIGLIVFKDAAEQMDMVQRVSQFETKLRQQSSKRLPVYDLFSSPEDQPEPVNVRDNRMLARKYLLTRLSATPLLLDNYCWANFLEESDLYPTDLQLAFKELTKEGKIKNLDADVHKRTKNPVRPHWPRKSEHWVLCAESFSSKDTY